MVCIIIVVVRMVIVLVLVLVVCLIVVLIFLFSSFASLKVDKSPSFWLCFIKAVVKSSLISTSCQVMLFLLIGQPITHYPSVAECSTRYRIHVGAFNPTYNIQL